MTHTVATLAVSAEAHAEISALLRAAGYDHAFMADGLVDMTGLALEAAPAPPAASLTDEQKQKVREAVHGALGEAYDCTRTWNAWSVGTMSRDDFTSVAEDEGRLEEIVDAAIGAMTWTARTT